MSDAAAEAGKEKAAGSGKKRVALIAAPPALLLAALAGAYLAGLPPFSGGEAEATKPAHAARVDPSKVVFVDLPEMLVNLNSDGKKARFLKLRASVEVGSPETAEQIGKLMPRVVDGLQLFLREVRPEDLQGSAGLYRFKEELLARVTRATEPLEVQDVLIREMLVQ